MSESGNRAGENGANTQTQGEDRRARSDMRGIFTDVCRITAPFFDPAHGWGSSSLTLYARQTVREAYPDLTQQDIAILLSAVQRFHCVKYGKQ
jgi:hypothetical protein